VTVNHSETTVVLTLCAGYDQRTIGEADVAAWQAALDDIDLGDAQRAVIGWYQSTRERIAVSDIRAWVRAIRAARLPHIGAGMEEHVPEADPDDVPAYLAALRAGRAQLAAAGQRRYDPDRLAANLFRRPAARAAIARQETDQPRAAG
jgi:hypothetical protein